MTETGTDNRIAPGELNGLKDKGQKKDGSKII